MAVSVASATPAEAPLVIALVEQLLTELGGFDTFDTPTATELCSQLLAASSYTALLARDSEGKTIGVLTLQECPALYVAGRIGWMQEFYVVPEARSSGVGRLLVESAEALAHSRQWKRLEVNTPDASAWPRTVAFYRREGFAGGSYHLRKALA